MCRAGKKTLWPTWLSFSLAELRCLFNVFVPLPEPSQAFRLAWFWWRRTQRLRAVVCRYGQRGGDLALFFEGFPLPLPPSVGL